MRGQCKAAQDSDLRGSSPGTTLERAKSSQSWRMGLSIRRTPPHSPAQSSSVLRLGVTVGRQVDVVTHGRVKRLIGATPAAIIYASDTAGEPSATAGNEIGNCRPRQSRLTCFSSTMQQVAPRKVVGL